MTLTSVSTYASHQNLLRDLGRTQSDLSTLQNQVSSGLKSDNFEGLSGQVELFTSLDAQIKKAAQYTENNKVAQARINVMGTALDQSVDTAGDLKSLLLLRRNGSFNDSLSFEQQLNGYWQSLTGQLNTNMEGRYLFSGTATNSKAVNDQDFPALAVEGTPDAGYYKGSSQDITLRADDNYDIKYSIRANDPAFQKLFAGLAMAKEGDVKNDDTMLSKAYDLIDQAQQSIIGLKNTLDTNKVQLDTINNNNDSKSLYWKQVTEDQTKTDMVSASTQVAMDQAVLQASFQVFAKISSLNLADFLR